MSGFERYCYLCNQGPITGLSQWEQHISGKKHKKNEWTKGNSMQSDLPDDKRSTVFVPSHTNVVEIEVPVMFAEDDDDIIPYTEETGAPSSNSNLDFPPIGSGASKPDGFGDGFPALSSTQSSGARAEDLSNKMANMSLGRGRGRSRPKLQNEKPSNEISPSWSSIAKPSDHQTPEIKPSPRVLTTETEQRPLTQAERSGNVRVIRQPQQPISMVKPGNRPMAKNPKFAMAKRIYHEFKANKKTASQAFQEIATTLQWEIENEEVAPSPGSFCSYAMKWKVNGFDCEQGEGTKKKQAKENASRKALAGLAHVIENPDRGFTVDEPELPRRSVSRNPHNPPDDYKRLTMTKVEELLKRTSVQNQPVRFAAFIVTRSIEQSSSNGIVVAIGSGRYVTKMTNRDAAEAYGYRLHDMQAPVLAKRAFQAFLYGQLSQARQGPGGSYKYGENILEFNPNSGRFRLKDGVRIHLYLSHPPNGDATAYISDNWEEPDVMSEGDLDRDLNGILKPLPEDIDKGCGRLRVVIDAVRGDTAILGERGLNIRGHKVASSPLNESDKVRIMSLSDKLLKWNHVGVQGGLLTHFIEPVFLHSIQMGMGYSHGHVARALLTRVPLSLFPSMPEGYRNIVDPYLGRTTRLTRLRNQIEGPISMNWFLGTNDVEVIDCNEGTIDIQSSGSGDAECSRLSRVTMLQRFEARWSANISGGDVISTALTKRLRQTLGTGFKKTNYLTLKNAASDYQTSKSRLYSVLSDGQMGTWRRKVDLQKFTLNDYEEDA